MENVLGSKRELCQNYNGLSRLLGLTFECGAEAAMTPLCPRSGKIVGGGPTMDKEVSGAGDRQPQARDE